MPLSALLVLLAAAGRFDFDPGARDRPRVGAADVTVAVSGPLLPSGSVRHLAIDRAGTVWFRVARPGGGGDGVVAIDRAGRRRTYPSLTAAVESNPAAVRGLGTLVDFWAVDGKGNLWVGPAYFDGQAWVEVARDQSYPGGGLRYEERVVVDGAGNAWVPFRTRGDCAMGGACEAGGLAGFNPAGELVRELALDIPSAPASFDLPFVRFEHSADGAAALSARAAYLLPNAAPRVYPGLLADPNTGVRPSGFASASAARPDGDAAVYTWVEPPAADRIPLVAEVAGLRGTWRSTDLAASPLFTQGTRGRFITAAAYAADGTLWVASSAGELAARDGEVWTEHFTPANSPLGGVIYDLAVDADGAVWIATGRGARWYKDGVWRTSFALHLPAGAKACGWLHPCFVGAAAVGESPR